mgnify:CR=1 FL=1
MYLTYDDITTVHIEHTSKCNLLCPQCARVVDGKILSFDYIRGGPLRVAAAAACAGPPVRARDGDLRADEASPPGGAALVSGRARQ